MWPIYNEILFSHGREGNPANCDNMDGTCGRYAELNKSGTERKTLHDRAYRSNLKNSNSEKRREEEWLPEAKGWRNQGDVAQKAQTSSQKMNKFQGLEQTAL